MRGAEHVDIAVPHRGDADGIDDQLPVLVTADRLAVPRRLHMFRMPVGQGDAAHPLVALPEDPHLLRSLNEIQRFCRPQQLTGHSPRPTARLRQERISNLAGQQLLVRQTHLLGRPRLEDRVFPVAERGRRPACVVAAQRVIGMLLDRPAQAGGRVEPAGAVARDPAVYRQRRPGKTARRGEVGNLPGRIRGRGAAGASGNGGTGQDSSQPPSARGRPAPGLQSEE